MFEALRKMIVPIIVIVLLFFVAMIVLEWGLDITGRQKGASANDAGSINGEKISWNEWQQVYNNVVQQETKNDQQDVTEAQTKEMEQSAWQQLVHEKLVMQEAAKHNIVVTDQELFAYLLMSPPTYLQNASMFQTNGKFDYEKYKQAMADPKASALWSSIEPDIRTELTRLKLQEMVIQTAQVTEPEVKQAFVDDREKVKVGFIDVPYSKYLGQLPVDNDQDLRAYYDQHKDQYKLGERATLKIALLEKAPTEEDWQQTKARLQVVYDSIKAGSDFAEMAKAYSEDGVAAKGGDLDWFGAGKMPPEIDKVVFAMKEGEVSEPFRTQFGWHIIKNLGFRTDPSAPKGTTGERQVHAAHIIMRVNATQASLDAMFQKLQDLRTAAAEKGFDQAAKDAGIQLKMAPPFERTSPVPFIGNDAVADSFAFTNPEGTISDVLENTTSYYVVQVDKRLPAGLATFDEVKGKVSQDLRMQKVAAICHDTAQAVYNQARSSSDLKAVAARFGLEYRESEMVNRAGYLPYIGRDPRAMGAVFAMTSVGQTVGPVDHGQGSMVARLLDRQTADLTQYNEKHDSVLNVVRSAKQQALYSNWVRSLIQQSKIESNIGKAARAGS